MTIKTLSALLGVATALSLSFGSSASAEVVFQDIATEKTQSNLEVEALVDSIIQHEMEMSLIPGAAFSLVKDGEVLISKGYGVSNVDSQVPVTAETVFRIGSITKVFTTLAITQLVDRGLINLDDDVNQYLRQFKIDDRFSDPVRFRHLLTHTAGFDQIFLAREGARESDVFSLASFLEDNLVRVRPPGQVSSYDTYGITLAGHLVEQISGLPFDLYLEREIFAPLGMDRSSVRVPPQDAAEVAVGYRLEQEELVAQAWEYYRSTPASSINSTATDMALFMISVLSPQKAEQAGLWSEETGKRIQAPQFTNFPGFPGFTHGFWDEENNGVRAIFHGGNMLGFESQMYLIPGLNLGFFFNYNREGSPFPRLRVALTEALVDHYSPNAANLITNEERSMQISADRFEGVYADNIYCRTCYEGEGGRMAAFPILSTGPGMIEIQGREYRAIGPLLFTQVDGPGQVAFREGPDGSITHMFRGSYVHEKLGERLLDETLGSDRETKVYPFEARIHRITRNWEAAADAYRKVIEVRPYDGALHHYLGTVLLEDGRSEEALDALETAWSLERWPSFTAYYIARAKGMMNSSEEAFEWLERAASLGFRDRRVVEAHPAFEALHEDPRWEPLLRKFDAPHQMNH